MLAHPFSPNDDLPAADIAGSKCNASLRCPYANNESLNALGILVSPLLAGVPLAGVLQAWLPWLQPLLAISPGRSRPQ